MYSDVLNSIKIFYFTVKFIYIYITPGLTQNRFIRSNDLSLIYILDTLPNV